MPGGQGNGADPSAAMASACGVPGVPRISAECLHVRSLEPSWLRVGTCMRSAEDREQALTQKGLKVFPSLPHEHTHAHVQRCCKRMTACLGAWLRSCIVPTLCVWYTVQKYTCACGVHMRAA
mmetsp:Transcript_5267/g.15958  ORF Transcript_5267/g.15958 Transcript_5267/m.15958 type:complete len:122 (-) Transcript_5267:2915-3280(-)